MQLCKLSWTQPHSLHGITHTADRLNDSAFTSQETRHDMLQLSYRCLGMYMESHTQVSLETISGFRNRIKPAAVSVLYIMLQTGMVPGMVQP